MSSTNITTNVPPVQLTPTGIQLPGAQANLAGALADINQAFGGNLNPDLRTPQGQLASSAAAIISNNNAMFAWLVSQIDPNNASGTMQDAIGYFYFMTRKPGTSTVVQCTCVGAVGTTIPVGAQAQDTSQNQYVCTQAGTIPSSGSITLPFAAVNLGPIACPAGTLTQIAQGIPGWDSINNAADGILGQNVESRNAFEARRRASVALNALGYVDSIYANVFNVSGVTDCYVYENTTSAAVTVGATNYSVAPKSVYVAVVGGAAADVANAIWIKKGLGCGYNGNTTVTVYDTNTPAPYVQYPVSYNTPTALPIYVAVQIATNSSLPSNITTLIQNAIIASFTGQDGSLPARIGGTIYASKFVGPTVATNSNVQVNSLQIGTASPAASNSVTVGIDQYPTLSAANISVTYV